MTRTEKPETVFTPFGRRALAWAAIVEAAVRTGERVFNIPVEYSSVYSVLAGQAFESAGIAYQKAKSFLATLDIKQLPDDVPVSIRPYLTEPIIKEARQGLDDTYQKWLSTVDDVWRENPLGMRAGIKPIHFS